MNKKYDDLVWQIFNKIRGVFEPIDMLKASLCLVILKYIENEKKSLSMYDEKFSINYLALTYGKMIQASEIANYVNQLEYEKKLDRGLISETIEYTFAKLGEDNVIQLCKLLSEIDLNDNKTCFDFAVKMIEKVIAETGKSAGLIGTNYSLAKLEAKLLNVENGQKVYDPYCGTGLSSNLAADNKGKIYIQDNNAGIICIATILTLLNNTTIGIIKCGDSVLSPISQEEKYDKIIMEPPFGIRYEKNYMEHIDSNSVIYSEIFDAETLAIRHAICKLKDDGMAIVLMPMGVLFKSGKTGEVRERLVKDNYIDTIIELPGGIIPGTGVPSALIVLKKDKRNNDIFMIDSKGFFEKDNKKSIFINDDKITEIASVFRNNKGIEEISKMVSLDEILNNDYNLCPMQYLTLKDSAEIVVEDVGAYVNKNIELSQKLIELDTKLSKLRDRFVNNN